MSLELRPVQVRLSEDAYTELQILAAAQDKDLGEVCRELVTRALLGEGHAVRLAAARLSRAVASGSAREDAVGSGSKRK